MVKMSKFRIIIAMMVIFTLILSGCSSKTTEGAAAAVVESTEGTTTETVEAEAPAYELKGKTDFIVPGGAGGGWDTTMRTVAKTLQDTDLVTSPMPVTNLSGGGGGVALADLQKKAGDDKTLVVYSPPLLLINLNGTSEFSYNDLTPIARLITDYGVFVVAQDSPYQTINDVMDALKADPKSVKFGGNSSAGSMDHIQFLIAAKAAGVENLGQLNYISFQNNEGAAQVLGGHIDLFSSGLADVAGLLESGDLRALATTADKRVGTGALLEVPTLMEEGIDVTFFNWRGIFGPKDMPADALAFWQTTFEAMTQTQEWKDACTKNGWSESFATSEEFKTFLDGVNEEYKVILDDIGMLVKQ